KFKIEVLSGSSLNGSKPSMVSVYHAEGKRYVKKDGSSSYACTTCSTRTDCDLVEQTTSYSFAYQFDPKTGNLQTVATYSGDFTQPGFRWNEALVEESTKNQISGHRNDSIRNLIKSIDKELQSEEKSVKRTKLKTAEQLAKLRSSLRNIVKK
ncbi:hypothetical protein HON01_00950, partial [Candidatus Woesearchaeota archaeon]|nr:hypothetical protein [Candidatus Woesearchaeota archaeon]